jgi:isochorismate synthase
VETTNRKIDIIESFQNLCKKYPNAFVHLISNSITGTWLGASPEKFIQVNDNKMSTVALAGTLNRTKRTDWTEKEKIEQKWVEVHIEKVLSNLEMQFEKDGPKELQIGNLQHLITEYQTKITESTKTEVVINKLNPTPAVCGIPFEEANKFIMENESYSRSFYSGVIGPYFNKNKFDLFVNLRCLQITKEHIIQYAGAGITKDSIAEAEWEETKSKIEMTKGLLTFI